MKKIRHSKLPITLESSDTLDIGMLFLTWLGIEIVGLDYRIFVPILTFVWFFSHICEAFVIQHYMEKNVPKWIQKLQIK